MWEEEVISPSAGESLRQQDYPSTAFSLVVHYHSLLTDTETPHSDQIWLSSTAIAVVENPYEQDYRLTAAFDKLTVACQRQMLFAGV